MRFCIQNAVNTMEMKDSRLGSRGPYHLGGGYGTGDRDHIYIYICVCNFVSTQTIQNAIPTDFSSTKASREGSEYHYCTI